MAVLSIKIDGTDASQYLRYYTLRITWQLGTTPVAQLTLVDPAGAFRPNVGSKLEIFNGATLIWGGTFDDDTESVMDLRGPAASAIQINCTATGWEKRLDTIRLYQFRWTFQNRAFTADSGTSTLTTLTTLGNGMSDGCAVQVANTGGALPGGLAANTTYYVVNSVNSMAVGTSTLQLSLTAGGSPVSLSDDGSGLNEVVWTGGGILTAIWAQNSYDTFEGITLADVRAGNTITSLPIDHATLTDVGNALLAANPGFVLYIDASLGLHFVPKTANPAPVNFISAGGGSDTHNIRGFSVEALRQDYANLRFLQFDATTFTQRRQTTLVTDGVVRQWQVEPPIQSVKDLVITPSGGGLPVHPTVGMLGSTGSDFYIQPGTDTLYQDSGGTVLGSGDALFIDYVEYGGATVVSPASLTSAEITARAAIEHNSGQYMALSQDTSITDPLVAQQAADNLVILYGQIPQLVTINTNDDGVLPGQTTTVNFPVNNVNGDFLVTQVDFSEVSGQDGSTFEYAIQASSQAVRTWFQFLQILAAGGGGGAVAAAGGGGGGGGSLNLVLALTLTASPTNITSPSTPTDGQALLVILTQDSTGGRVVIWDSTFKSPPVNIGTLQDTVTIASFMGSGGFWWLSGQPITGVTP